MNLSKQILGSSLSLPAYERAGQTQHLFFWRRISQSEIRNSAAAEKSESESEGGQKLVPCRDTGFLPPNPLPFCPPERSVWRAPARRSLGEGGKRAVNSVQKRFGFGRINAQEQGFIPPLLSAICAPCRDALSASVSLGYRSCRNTLWNGRGPPPPAK